MARSLAALLAAAVAGAAGVAAADGSTTTIPVLLPMFDKQKLVGSVVDADSTLTTFAVACAPGVKADECGFPGTFTVLQGPSTWSLSLGVSMGDDIDVTVAYVPTQPKPPRLVHSFMAACHFANPRAPR